MTPGEPPHGCTWGRYLELLTQAHGGLVPLVDLLIRRASGQVELPEDPQSIERGLRRLSAKGNAPGGQYGRWLLRFFGVPRPLVDQARWMGQYHSRFSDLPRSLCESQLLLWDRPPICEAPEAAWIHLGLAAVAMRRKDEAGAKERLALALARPGDEAARVEALLLKARLEQGAQSERTLQEARGLIEQLQSKEDRLCYLARCCDQEAYALSHPEEGPPRFKEAKARYEEISSDHALPFVLFKRAHGLAYTSWKLGLPDARQHAEAALSHAGDGGFVRFRVMALELLAHIALGEEAEGLRARARRMAQQLQHEDL